MKVLIVDDTRLARQELKTLLAAHADMELIGEADDLFIAVVNGNAAQTLGVGVGETVEVATE